MKNRKRLFTLSLLLLLSLSLLVACNEKEADVSEDEAIEENNEEVVEEPKEDSEEEENDEETDSEETDSEEVEKVDTSKKEESMKLMDDYVEQIKEKEEKITEIKPVKKDNWYEFTIVLSDNFINSSKDMDKSALDETLKELRKEVFQALGKSGALNFDSETKTIVVHYEDESGKEVFKTSTIDPD